MQFVPYLAFAYREGRWWVVEIPGIGVTQGRTRRGARSMARDLIAARFDIPRKDVRVVIEWR